MTRTARSSDDVAIHPSQDQRMPDQEISSLAGKAAQCRRLARGISDKQASEVLRNMADNYDRRVESLRSNEG
jgi:hypothetical protein